MASFQEAVSCRFLPPDGVADGPEAEDDYGSDRGFKICPGPQKILESCGVAAALRQKQLVVTGPSPKRFVCAFWRGKAMLSGQHIGHQPRTPKSHLGHESHEGRATRLALLERSRAALFRWQPSGLSTA